MSQSTIMWFEEISKFNKRSEASELEISLITSTILKLDESLLPKIFSLMPEIQILFYKLFSSYKIVGDIKGINES